MPVSAPVRSSWLTGLHASRACPRPASAVGSVSGSVPCESAIALWSLCSPASQDRSANRDSCLRKSFRLHAKIGTRGAVPGRPRRSTVVDSRPENRRKCTQNHLRIRKIEAESMVQSMEGPHAAERLLPPRISAATIDCVTELPSSSTGTTPSTRARPQHAWRARPRCCS